MITVRRIYLAFHFLAAVSPAVLAVQALIAYSMFGINLSLFVFAAAVVLSAILFVSLVQIYKGRLKSVWILISRIVFILASVVLILFAGGSLLLAGVETFAVYWAVLKVGFSEPELLVAFSFPIFALPAAVLGFFKRCQAPLRDAV